jgi:NAD(P)-dependent dehydrogenase (short-subunit alcohol dehydrogenase family)/quinol monooxygenase YgiN
MQEIEIVRIPVLPANAKALETAIRERRLDYFGPPTCVGLEVGASADGSEIIALVTWASKDAHEAARKSPGAAMLFAAVGKFAAGAPSIASVEASARTGRLAGQVVLVTGGASGIGRAVVDRFVAEGARVAVADKDAHGLASVREAHGSTVTTIATDLSTSSGNREVVEQTVAAFGKLDCLVANAGVFDGFRDFATLDLEGLNRGFDSIFDVNVRGLMLSCRAALPHLAASGGSIIVTLSNASFIPDGGGVMYVASKHAALGVVRQLAHELAPRVRVNGVAPGATKTSLRVPEVFGESPDQRAPEISAAIAKLVPLETHSEPADHTGAYVLLAARDESPAMTGTVINSDGGLGVRGLRRTRGGERLGDILGVGPA